MESITSADDLYFLIEKYRAELSETTEMDDFQKFEMLAIVEYSLVLHESLLDGTLYPILSQIMAQQKWQRRGRRLPTNHCPIEIGYCKTVECLEAGGTAVLPLVGTATGCVGGAVFGATSGFVGGALLGIAGELLLSCGR